MTTALYRTTCIACEAIKYSLVAVVMFLWGIGESAGRARAAAELHRQGYPAAAKRLMLEDTKQ